jgi:hypothetical protein
MLPRGGFFINTSAYMLCYEGSIHAQTLGQITLAKASSSKIFMESKPKSLMCYGLIINDM